MKLHQLSEYSDGLKKISFCEVCGMENPIDYCPGEFVQDKPVDKKVDTETKQS